MGFWADYQEKIASGGLKPDDGQAAVARKLEALATALENYDPRPSGFFARLMRPRNEFGG